MTWATFMTEQALRELETIVPDQIRGSKALQGGNRGLRRDAMGDTVEAPGLCPAEEVGPQRAIGQRHERPRPAGARGITEPVAPQDPQGAQPQVASDVSEVPDIGFP